jgi:hypothetical protein
MAPQQLGLLDRVARQERPWKRQRQTAREVYRQVRERDQARAAAGKETREAQALRLLAWHWNATQQSPTARELFEWAKAKGQRLDDINSIRPRLHALVEQGLVAPGAKRRCEVSGKTVHTWHVREAGELKGR